MNLVGRASWQNCFELFISAHKDQVIKACKTEADGRVVEGNHTFYRISAPTAEEKDEWIDSIKWATLKPPLQEVPYLTLPPPPPAERPSAKTRSSRCWPLARRRSRLWRGCRAAEDYIVGRFDWTRTRFLRCCCSDAWTRRRIRLLKKLRLCPVWTGAASVPTARSLPSRLKCNFPPRDEMIQSESILYCILFLNTTTSAALKLGPVVSSLSAAPQTGDVFTGWSPGEKTAADVW